MSRERGEVRNDLRVVGRVQGVGFRMWACQRGGSMGVRGTVRNADDGSVEVRFAGGEEASARFREVLEIGPGAARVERVESIPVDGDLPERGIEVTW